jgi:predicted SAM-dependent methyltransferase
MDLNKKAWHYAPNSVDIVYASHFLEHLSRSAAVFLVKESFKALKPNGVIRIIVPDLYQNAKNYVVALENGNKQASEELMYILDLHQEQAYGGNKSLFTRFINWYQDYPHQHKFMYDKYSLYKLLEEQGFREIKESVYGKSNYIDNITEVEYTSEGIPAIYLEALK